MFYLLKENFKSFFQLLYVISSFWLFINANSCSRNVNAMYSALVIMALKSCNLSLPQLYSHPNNKAKIFDPLVTVRGSTVLLSQNLDFVIYANFEFHCQYKRDSARCPHHTHPVWSWVFWVIQISSEGVGLGKINFSS